MQGGNGGMVPIAAPSYSLADSWHLISPLRNLQCLRGLPFPANDTKAFVFISSFYKGFIELKIIYFVSGI
jgi:hypothetical protein